MLPEDVAEGELRERLLQIVRERALRRGRFRLASGKESSFYVDMRRCTTHPEGAYLCARLLLRLLDPWQPQAVGGPTLGADPLAGALAAVSHLEGRPLRTFMVRPQAKDHGTQRRVEGSLEPGDRAVVVDDVATSGSNLVQAAEAVKEAGGVVVGAAAILDREAGARGRLEALGIPFLSVFRLRDLGLPAEEGT
jgi:orotate phosphoribosyltransferase